MTERHLSFIDRLIVEADNTLRTLTTGFSTKPCGPTKSPAAAITETALTDAERKHSAGLMRVNHTGEVCAQALYRGQALTAKLEHTRQEMEVAAEEETAHLHWCALRLQELHSRSSLLNPVFYGLSFSLGALAGAVGDSISLGFVAATEELVCKHLSTHLQQLPEKDHKSRAIVKQMREDEARHQQTAISAGASQFPPPVKFTMSTLSKAMTKSSYYV
ncbi:MAG: 2-polyprenyl-3-methyl-6-methoxy-1,4-benzoquinone monooxygenase [Cellvibrionaceae bacterium]|nr:2-polyprenyl-3-methyl-6-methoxy-1,4-benzoquinone monooxygenase [Cellvibrionaceae bacterium]